MSFTNDTRHTGTLNSDSRNSAPTFTVDSYSSGQYLWQMTLPWQTQFPWQITGGYPILNQDVRN